MRADPRGTHVPFGTGVPCLQRAVNPALGDPRPDSQLQATGVVVGLRTDATGTSPSAGFGARSFQSYQRIFLMWQHGMLSEGTKAGS